MARKPTYKELEQRVEEFEREATKRKQAEESLWEFREFKEKIISESPIGMSIYDASGQCVAANDSIGELIGATKEQVLEQNYNNIESWKKSGMLDKAKSAIRENSKKRYELIVKSTFGKDVSLDCHLVPFSSGGQKHLLLMINDISERIRAEEALKIMTDEQAVLLASVPAMIFWIDKEGNFIRVNEPFAAALRKSPDEISGKSLFDLYPENQARRYHNDNLEVIESGNPKKNIYEPVQTPAGTMWVYTDKIPYRDKEGNNAGIIGFSVDITERKRAEARIEEQLRFLQTLVDTMPTPIFYKDKDGKYTGCNKAFEEFVGRPREKIIGKTVYDVGSKRIANKYHEKDRELFQNPGKQVYEWKVKRKTGELREVVFNKATFTDADGKVAGLIGGIFDITKRKQVEERLRQREAALKIRTNELEEANTALKVLLKRREEDMTEVEQKVLLNVNELVVPYAEKLKKTFLDKQQIAYLNLLESNLNNITSPFTYKLSSKPLGLTPKEIHVANLVKDGKTAKEIAEVLNVSVRTIESHRKSIRVKIGLKNSRINLRSRLLSM